MTNFNWRARASCRGADPELFFPVGYEWVGEGNEARAEKAKAFCERCPVALECLSEAVEIGDMVAILGGTTPEERAHLVRLSRIVSAA